MQNERKVLYVLYYIELCKIPSPSYTMLYDYSKGLQETSYDSNWAREGGNVENDNVPLLLSLIVTSVHAALWGE